MTVFPFPVPFLATTAVLLVACAPTPAPVDVPPVTIMTFNVENLFDTEDDPGKDDRTFLPLAAKQTDEHIAACNSIEVPHWRDQCLNWDWNDELLERKLSVVAETILQVDDGRGPDIVALQEIENLAILERLRKDYLGAANYRPGILIDGSDERGIDVAFLSRLPLDGEPKLHPIPFDGVPQERIDDTRGILEATFRLPDGSLLTGYAVHFPAPFHPTDMRVAAYRFLNELESALPDDRATFAAGDFNTTSAENRARAMLQRLARPHWTVVHEYCESCPGSSYYARDDSWSFLDMILWAPAENRGAQATWQIRENSVRLANNTAAQVEDDGTPARFEMPGGTGVSDHWPLVVTLEIK
jgi:endonuclease/exonuclease/phosphatase family metal-dependent hydrolase